MLAALASADGVTWVSILVKTLAYGATLLAVGSVLACCTLGRLSLRGRASLRRLAAVSALAAALFSLVRLPVQASFLMGGTWAGATDPMLLALVAENPLGTSVALRLAGLGLILCILWPARPALWIALADAVMASASFAFRGHALSEPRAVLAVLITLHILGLAFWIGAFAPLAQAARHDPVRRAGALAHEFGTQALWVVGATVAAGAAMLGALGAATPGVLATAYGQMFLVKLAVFAGLLSLAAWNKLWLSPALRAAAPGAAARLRRSIGLEAVLVALILATTAALTTLAAPPP